MIQAIAPERLPFVEAFRGHVHELATHPFGCRVLQRCLENMPAEYTRPLLDEMLELNYISQCQAICEKVFTSFAKLEHALVGMVAQRRRQSVYQDLLLMCFQA